MSGGASFSPRLNPRPKPLRNIDVLRDVVVKNIRSPILAAAICKLFFPVYMGIVNWWQSYQLSDRFFLIASTMILHGVMYLGMNLVFLYWDRNGIFEQYKLHRTPLMGPSEALMQKTWRQAALNQLLSSPVVLYSLFPLFKYFGTPEVEAALPSFFQLCWMFLVAKTINDWGFYWAHRLVHSKALYARIHKQHHEYRGSIGFAAEYAHPFEQALANQGPTILGCILMGPHIHVWLCWVAMRLWNTYETHSGFCFYGTWLHRIGLTYSDKTAFHDFHHTGNQGNFGGAAYLDHLFGTMDAWIKIGGAEGYIARKRNRDFCNVLTKKEKTKS